MAEAGKEPAGLALPGGGAAQWPLQRYGRFMPLGTGEPAATGQDAGTASAPAWKVFDSNEESGYLVLTIVISGHFFISQGQTLLNKSRMFRVQFSGVSREQALERCCSCVQKLAQYVTVQVPDGACEELRPGPSPLTAGKSQGQDCAQRGPPQPGLPQNPEKPGPRGPVSRSASGGRAPVSWLAQSLLVSEELPPVYEQSTWDAEELGPFLRLCLMDQNFPAFVEEVEKELRKLTGLRN
uniref:REC114 meiotic recombination protein n=1 Tax=Canis lupus familiaris TaxID=9615 RepID=A0A8C0T067_CANLF